MEKNLTLFFWLSSCQTDLLKLKPFNATRTQTLSSVIIPCTIYRSCSCRGMKSCGAGGSSKKKMKMRGGFMCRTTMDSVACMSHDNAVRSSSFVVPRKKSSGRWVAEHAKSSICRRSDVSSSSPSSSCIADAKYMRLAEPPNLNISASKRGSAGKQAQAHGRYGTQPRSMASVLSAPPATDDVLQVVVMKVSIHCQGCAGQVKKHLSKMEGVTSFSIDVEAKRVVVMGNVSPAWVLASLSKVKKAELWTL